MKKYDFLIIGCGLFGSTVGYILSKHGKKCLVIDKRNHIGGNCYNEKKEGIIVHSYGPHIFHTSNKKTWDFVNSFVEFNNYINSPIANYKGDLYNLPFNMNTFTKMWDDVKTPNDVIEKINSQKYKGVVHNLEEQAISLVGKDIYEKLIKGYTEKQWGKQCDKLPKEIIKRLPVRLVFDNNYFNDTYQGIPINGYTEIFVKLLENCDVELNSDYFSSVDYYNSLSDKIIFTGEVDRYFNYKYGKLEYRSLRFENSILENENYQGVAVMNYTDSETKFTRITEHKHFEKNNTSKKTIITKEYPEIYNGENIPYYPIENEKNIELFLMYKKMADDEKNVYFGGRLGEYKYFNMDKIIENAFKMCEILL